MSFSVDVYGYIYGLFLVYLHSKYLVYAQITNILSTSFSSIDAKSTAENMWMLMTICASWVHALAVPMMWTSSMNMMCTPRTQIPMEMSPFHLTHLLSKVKAWIWPSCYCCWWFHFRKELHGAQNIFILGQYVSVPKHFIYSLIGSCDRQAPQQVGV